MSSASTARRNRFHQRLCNTLPWIFVWAVFIHFVDDKRAGIDDSSFVARSDLYWALGVIWIGGVVSLWAYGLGRALAVKWSGLRLGLLHVGDGPAVLRFTRGDADIRLGLAPWGAKAFYESGKSPLTVARRSRVMYLSFLPNLLLLIIAASFCWVGSPRVAGVAVAFALKQFMLVASPWLSRTSQREPGALREMRRRSQLFDAYERARVTADPTDIRLGVEALQLALNETTTPEAKFLVQLPLADLLSKQGAFEDAAQLLVKARENAAKSDPRRVALRGGEATLRLTAALQVGDDVDANLLTAYTRWIADDETPALVRNGAAEYRQALMLLANRQPATAIDSLLASLIALEKSVSPPADKARRRESTQALLAISYARQGDADQAESSLAQVRPSSPLYSAAVRELQAAKTLR